MKRTALTLLEVIALLATAATLALASNALRRDGLKLSKSYFEKPVPHTRATTQEGPPSTQQSPPTTQGSPTATRESTPTTQESPTTTQASQPATNTRQPDVEEHPFQVVTFEEAFGIINDELYELDVCIFVDARNDKQYEQGHIPRAWRLDPYHSDLYIDDLEQLARDAERIIIYCEGGDCEDAIFAGRELLEWGIELEKISLYEGGIEDWEAKGGPIEKGALE
ncbi:MAG TPA: rhodanese-like domain-containing protein [Phycisphaerae bacterium]|nr:rhodanese-like domain-containing protein [Phycisphaerae bacterium]